MPGKNWRSQLYFFLLSEGSGAGIGDASKKKEVVYKGKSIYERKLNRNKVQLPLKSFCCNNLRG